MTTMKYGVMDDVTRSKVQSMFASLEQNEVNIEDVEDAVRAIGLEKST